MFLSCFVPFRYAGFERPRFGAPDRTVPPRCSLRHHRVVSFDVSFVPSSTLSFTPEPSWDARCSSSSCRRISVPSFRSGLAERRWCSRGKPRPRPTSSPGIPGPPGRTTYWRWNGATRPCRNGPPPRGLCGRARPGRIPFARTMMMNRCCCRRACIPSSPSRRLRWWRRPRSRDNPR